MNEAPQYWLGCRIMAVDPRTRSWNIIAYGKLTQELTCIPCIVIVSDNSFYHPTTEAISTSHFNLL